MSNEQILRDALGWTVDFLATAPNGENCFLHDDSGEHDKCYCGKDDLIHVARVALESTTPTSQTAPDTPQPIAEPVAWLIFSRKDATYLGTIFTNPGPTPHLYRYEPVFGKPPTDTLHRQLADMTADCDKWQTAHADMLAELRKVSEELGALKGEHGKLFDAVLAGLSAAPTPEEP